MGMLIKYGAGGEHEFGAEFDDMDLPSRQEALAEVSSSWPDLQEVCHL